MHNDRELQQICATELAKIGLPGVDQCTIAMQWQDSDLGCVVYFPQLAKYRPGTDLIPWAGWIVEKAAEMTPQEMQSVAKDTAWKAVKVMREEFVRRNFEWPSGWPVVKDGPVIARAI